MAAFIDVCHTDGGRNIMALGQTGKAIRFSRIVLGDGFLPEGEGFVLRQISGLVHERISLDIPARGGVEAPGNGEVIIRAPFSNAALDMGFYYRELGAYAIHPDTGQEVLYCYGNAGDNAEWIPATGGTTIIEKLIRVVTVIGEAAEVSAHLTTGVLLTPEDLDRHNRDPEAHPNRGPTHHVATIHHEFDHTPMFALYRTEEDLGALPFGRGAFGGEPSRTVEAAFQVKGKRVDVYTLPEYAGEPEVIRHSRHQYALRFPGSATNLILKMR